MAQTEPRAQGTGRLPVVVVGAGGMGRAWISTVLRSRDARLVGVADVIDGAAAGAVAELVPADERDAVRTGTDALEVARAAGARAIIDVTIPAAHHAVTADALHAGYPVLGEKPCAATLAQALSLAGHAESTGRLFMVSQSRRHNPHLREAARLAGELGGAGIVATRFSRAPRFGGFREEMAQPLIVDMAIHAFDAARVLVAGTPESVTAVSSNPPWSWYDGDAAATVTIRFDSGAVHTYAGSWCSPGRETSWNGEWSLSCPHGTVAWDGENPPSATREDGREIPGRVPAADALWELDSSLAAFCAALREGTTPESEVHENVWTQAIVEAAVRSAGDGRTVALAEVMDEALTAARDLDRADGRSSALESWNTGSAGGGAV
ncbi:Gfo/Idh/MocA family oxidoreductase [Brachybacterium halotolerans subsp. kimchii]|uniref:Gfo/Idh/MocA family protein n=1 Tax=Brachybacterium halotolerans TaxID=2795215 RepID=UPI001E60A527|nr:Gfo/Idh/MocA family oxidoreductase [Brachybacterium halotolerans]UEJ81488.1 Gfo/Idh/MocA family oxidoreductase [Brachybacterium halotolerans subsp. kimchii]